MGKETAPKESDTTGSAAGVMNESRVGESACIHLQVYDGTTANGRKIEPYYFSVL